MRWPMESWHMLMFYIRHVGENSQVDSVHSSAEATSVLFHQHVTVLRLDQLSQDFKAPLSFPNINSKARPFDFTLEHDQIPTGVGLCWPLGPFPFQGGDCLLFPKGIAPQPDTTGWQLVSSHHTCQQRGKLTRDSQEYMAQLLLLIDHLNGRKTRKSKWNHWESCFLGMQLLYM